MVGTESRMLAKSGYAVARLDGRCRLGLFHHIVARNIWATANLVIRPVHLIPGSFRHVSPGVAVPVRIWYCLMVSLPHSVYWWFEIVAQQSI